MDTEPEQPKKNRYLQGLLLWPLLSVPAWWGTYALVTMTTVQVHRGVDLRGYVEGLLAAGLVCLVGGILYARYAISRWKMPALETSVGTVLVFVLLGASYLFGGCVAVAGVGAALNR